jgi:phage terminase large subunit-like protein
MTTSLPKPSDVLDPKTLDDLRSKGRRNLYFFSKAILGFDWLVPHVHLPLCEMLQDRTTNRARVVLPRGWLKSTIASVAWPMWEAVRNPNIRVLIAQNTFKNATKKLKVIKQLFEQNVLLRALYPEVLPNLAKGSTWREDALELTRSKPAAESTFEAAGTQTKVTSRHYDIIVEDDTVAPDLDDLTSSNVLPSPIDIERAIGWHRLVPPLLVDMTLSKNVIVGTRWSEDDLISWNTKNEKFYRSYERAAREDTHGKPCSNGEIVYKERFNDEVLSQLEATMGPYMFSCLYLNLPVRAEDMLFRPDAVQYYETAPKQLAIFTTVDPASDPGEVMTDDPDDSVVMTCGKDLTTGLVYVLDYTHGKFTPSELIQHIFTHVKRWSPIKVAVEKVGYQNTLLYWVRERMRTDGLYFTVEGVSRSTRVSKFTQIQGLQPIYHSKSILFRTHMTELLTQLWAYPHTKKDDLVDCLSMQLKLWYLTEGQRKSDEKETTGDVRTVRGLIDYFNERSVSDDLFGDVPYTPVLDYDLNFSLAR